MRAYVDCRFFFSVSHSDLMVRIPEQSGQYLLSLLVVGRWDRDWGGGSLICYFGVHGWGPTPRVLSRCY